MTLNVTGSFHDTINPDGSITSVATGRSLLTDPVTEGLELVIGRLSYVTDAEGNIFLILRVACGRVKILIIARHEIPKDKPFRYDPGITSESRAPHWVSTFSIRRSGMSQMTATSTYRAQANHEFKKESGMATA